VKNAKVWPESMVAPEHQDPPSQRVGIASHVQEFAYPISLSVRSSGGILAFLEHFACLMK